jgi:outer membrane protein OmpA-like peptidoglycan-associated protein
VEVVFNTQTNITGNLYAANGKKLLNSITLEIPDLVPGGIAFRGHALHVDDIRGGARMLNTDTLFALKLGQPLVLKNISFETNKSVLLAPSFTELDKLVTYLKSNPTYKVNIVGHTDNIGNEADNKNLSQARAKSVADYLIMRGVSKTNIRFTGLGSTNPIATNATEEGRKKNRRVECTISNK